MLRRWQGSLLAVGEAAFTPEVRARVLGRMQQDAEIAARHNLPAREDIQKAREMVSRA
jgi:hypothetical protein